MAYFLIGLCFVLVHTGLIFWPGVGRAIANFPGLFSLYAALLPAGAFLLGIGAGFCIGRIGRRAELRGDNSPNQFCARLHGKRLATMSLIVCVVLCICCAFTDIASSILAYRFAISLLLFIIGLAASLIESRHSA